MSGAPDHKYLAAQSATLGEICQQYGSLCAEFWQPIHKKLILTRIAHWYAPQCPMPAIRILKKTPHHAPPESTPFCAWLERRPQYGNVLDIQSTKVENLVSLWSGGKFELSIPLLQQEQVVAVASFYFLDSLTPAAIAELVSTCIYQLAQPLTSNLYNSLQEEGNNYPSNTLTSSTYLSLISTAQSVKTEVKHLNSNDQVQMFEEFIGTFRVTSDGRFTYANQTFIQLMGYQSLDKFLGDSQHSTSHFFKDLTKQQEIIAALSERDAIRDVEFEAKRSDGTSIWLSIHARAIRSPDSYQLVGWEGAVEDVSSKVKDREMIELMAYYDLLTGLANRMLFNDRLTQAITQAQKHKTSLAILFVDLDRFKIINDSLGHVVGDILLQAVSKRLSHVVTESETLARWGADAFTILIPEITSIEQVAKRACKIQNEFEEYFRCEGHTLHLTCSIGISLYPNDGETTQSLLQNADTALSRAKDYAPNSYQFYSSKMNADATNQLSLENDLRLAIKRDELTLFYQPLINLKSNQIIGWEALLRWHHPQRGLLFPDEFISVSEETGIITRLTEWILKTACHQLKQWHERGFESFTMAVNLSAIEFQQPQLIKLVEEVILETGLSAHSLELEITESIAMQDINQTKQTLEALSKMGVRISIDDFGTGYSSISYLRQFPCHTLKVDRSFIIDLGTSESADLVGQSVINLGQGLNLTVVAEGVETQEQLDFLRRVQCDKVQGYWFSEPKPVEEIEPLLIAQAPIKHAELKDKV